MFDVSRFEKLLVASTEGSSKPLLIRPRLEYHLETTSTMDLASAKVYSSTAQSGDLILAECQTKGRGRKGRSWQQSQQPGLNLAFTLALHLHKYDEMFKLNFATPTAIALTCKQEKEDLDVGIKWPNDVWIKGKKLGGILLDSNTMGSNIWACLGVGLNLNQPMNTEDVPAEIRGVATSLRDELNQKIDREAFLARFCVNLDQLFQKSLREILDVYNTFDILCGRKVFVMPKGVEDPLRVEAEALEFTENGSLRVRFESGEVKELYAEEVSIRPSL